MIACGSRMRCLWLADVPPAARGRAVRASLAPLAYLVPLAPRAACSRTINKVRLHVLTGQEFFPDLISAPFHQGLTVVFAVATGLSVLAALASLLGVIITAASMQDRDGAAVAVESPPCAVTSAT